jgi:hypothetical protein
MRFETKYILSFSELSKFYTWLYTSRLSFYRQYPDRLINSLYYDTYNQKSLKDNIDGISARDKLRLRWYGAHELPNNCTLEIKHKRNSLGFKSCHKYYDLHTYENHKELYDLIFAKTPDNFKRFLLLYSFPVSIIRYNRSYYSSFNNYIRLTIDSKISYSKQKNNIINLNNDQSVQPSFIVEFKFDYKSKEYLYSNLQNLPIRLTKNSKYVNSQLINL